MSREEEAVLREQVKNSERELNLKVGSLN